MRTQKVVTTATTVLTLALLAAPAGAAGATPQTAEQACANGAPCASVPECPTRAVQLPPGPGRASSGPDAADCARVTIAPRATTGEFAATGTRS